MIMMIDVPSFSRSSNNRSRICASIVSSRDVVGSSQIITLGRLPYKDEQGEWVTVGDNTPVSMNVWGFTPDYFQHSEEYFKEFLSDPKNMENIVNLLYSFVVLSKSQMFD